MFSVTLAELGLVSARLENAGPFPIDCCSTVLSYTKFEGGDVRIISVKAEVCGVEDMRLSVRSSGDTGSDTSSMASSQFMLLGLFPSWDLLGVMSWLLAALTA